MIDNKNKPITLTALLILLLIAGTGCDKYSRYKVLTFFFTGVPRVDGSDTDDTAGKKIDVEQLLEQKRNEQIGKIFYYHGPFAAQQCYQCHSTASSATFRGFGNKRTTSDKEKVQNVSSRLVMPVKELCIDCHTAMSVTGAYKRELWVHGPVSEGICTTCHSPHSSPYPFMLLTGTTKELCTSCHKQGFILESEDHKKDEDCTACHNPHIGKDRFLLKKDFDESLL